jgi:hypothetical protein
MSHNSIASSGLLRTQPLRLFKRYHPPGCRFKASRSNLGSEQKPVYSELIWLPSHIRTDSPVVLRTAHQPCAICLIWDFIEAAYLDYSLDWQKDDVLHHCCLPFMFI